MGEGESERHLRDYNEDSMKMIIFQIQALSYNCRMHAVRLIIADSPTQLPGDVLQSPLFLPSFEIRLI